MPATEHDEERVGSIGPNSDVPRKRQAETLRRSIASRTRLSKRVGDGSSTENLLGSSFGWTLGVGCRIGGLEQPSPSS
jgi:hypothetical protein